MSRRPTTPQRSKTSNYMMFLGAAPAPARTSSFHRMIGTDAGVETEEEVEEEEEVETEPPPRDARKARKARRRKDARRTSSLLFAPTGVGASSLRNIERRGSQVSVEAAEQVAAEVLPPPDEGESGRTIFARATTRVSFAPPPGELPPPPTLTPLAPPPGESPPPPTLTPLAALSEDDVQQLLVAWGLAPCFGKGLAEEGADGAALGDITELADLEDFSATSSRRQQKKFLRLIGEAREIGVVVKT